jgi:hypothetical protein
VKSALLPQKSMMQRKKAENTHGVDFVDFVDLSFGPGVGRG